MKSIKAIEVNAKEWFDKINGNSYFAGNIYIEFDNYRVVELIMPFQYGYGSYYEQEAKATLTQFNYISTEYGETLKRYCEKNNIKYRTNFKADCTKKELKAYI
jgi:hypothetical protein